MNKTFILIAEDDADDRFLLQTAFEERGYSDKIEFVHNGVELMQYLENNGSSSDKFPCFILMDLNMPKKDGRQVLEEIKRNPRFKQIPVIVFTTTKNEMEIRRCYELGANTYIVKPISFEALLHVVDNIKSYWLNTATLTV